MRIQLPAHEESIPLGGDIAISAEGDRLIAGSGGLRSPEAQKKNASVSEGRFNQYLSDVFSSQDRQGRRFRTW